MQVKKQQLELVMEQRTGSKLGKEYINAVYCPCYASVCSSVLCLVTTKIWSSQVLDKPCYSSQANQCYSSVLFRRQQENPSSKHEGMPTQRLEQKRVEECTGEGESERKSIRTQERKSEKAPWLLLLQVCSSTWACPMQIGLSQECCLFYLRSSLWSSDLPLTFLCSIFAGFSLPCLLATTILDSFSLFYLPNTKESAYQCREHGFNPWSQKIPHAQGQLSPRATIEVCMLQSPSSATRESTAMRSHGMATRGQPLLTTPRQTSNTDPAQSTVIHSHQRAASAHYNQTDQQ